MPFVADVVVFVDLSLVPYLLGFDLSTRVDGAHVCMRDDHEVPHEGFNCWQLQRVAAHL